MIIWLTEKWQIESKKIYFFYPTKYVQHSERFRTKYVDLTDRCVFITRQNL
jgi:hypothetical protein